MRRLLALGTALLLTQSIGLFAGPTEEAAAGGPTTVAAFTVSTLHFKVQVGPRGQQTCDVIGDLYVPKAASKTRRMPAILTTNGFGGSKDDQAGIGKAGAANGYVVLSYSGLGFGGSGCKITLDSPDFDGQAARQLVSFLGGARGIAFTDAKHTTAAPRLTVVKRDRRAHDGRRHANDPRIGMVGGSYGGQVQFAAASVDPRIDTIVPMITWNDLSYSLGPNNTDQSRGVSTRTPGATKLTWGLGFSVLGIATGVMNAPADPGRLLPCPNFATFVCPALVVAGSLGHFDPQSVTELRKASVASYMKKIKIPTLLLQGQGDTLFNLNEAAATYKALRKQGTPVKMVWHSWGHSRSLAAPGEFNQQAPNPKKDYESRRIFNWFSHYLKDTKKPTGPRFAWFRDWVKYDGIATPAFGTAKHFPVGRSRKFHLSGQSLVAQGKPIAKGNQMLLTTAAGLPTALNQLDALSFFMKLPMPEAELPGTTAAWTTRRLARPMDVVGSPKVRLKVGAPLTANALPATQLVLFVRVQDVGPDGKANDIESLTAPVRVPDVRKAFTVTLPAIVHRFAKGHRLRLVVSGGSLNYRGGLVPNPVTIRTGSPSQRLTLPVTN